MPALRILPVLLVALLVVSGSVAAVPSPRDRPSDTAPPVRVTEVVVRNQNSANVTNAWERDGESLTVTAEYNFAEVDRLDLTVEDSDGVDVNREVASGDRITTSGGSVQLDLSDQQEGTFRVTLEGSDLDRASRTVTVRTGPRRTATPLPSPTTPAGTPTANHRNLGGRDGTGGQDSQSGSCRASDRSLPVVGRCELHEGQVAVEHTVVVWRIADHLVDPVLPTEVGSRRLAVVVAGTPGVRTGAFEGGLAPGVGAFARDVGSHGRRFDLDGGHASVVDTTLQGAGVLADARHPVLAAGRQVETLLPVRAVLAGVGLAAVDELLADFGQPGADERDL
jgi:hypothetical protein